MGLFENGNITEIKEKTLLKFAKKLADESYGSSDEEKDPKNFSGGKKLR
jgi:hypothetical protein